MEQSASQTTGYDFTSGFRSTAKAIKYCTKVGKTGAADTESNNSAIVQPRITKFYKDIHAGLVFSYTEYDAPATSGWHLLKF